MTNEEVFMRAYEGRICDSKPFLEKYRRCDTDEEYSQNSTTSSMSI